VGRWLRLMLRVALTGGIGTGKSYVAGRLAEAGIPLVDADHLAREVVAPGTPGLAAIEARFGPAVLDGEGALRRAELARLVFADPAARRDLEAIVHPAVRALTDEFFAVLPPRTPFAVADIPLLFETGRDADFDVVVVAACPPDLQVTRVMARDGATDAEVRQRMGAQLPIAEKVRRADYVIDTSGSFEDTDVAVARVLTALTARAAAG
jgi:dephospho-CoA kinase